MTAYAWIDAAEAARRLGVARATLYAYVSRGFVRSQPAPGSSRGRHYSSEDVERMRRRTEERRDPDKAAARALQWGVPVLESGIACIDGERLYYRGHDAVLLSRTRSVEEIASLIWIGHFGEPFASIKEEHPEWIDRVDRDLSFIARGQAVLARAPASDPQAFDLRRRAVARTGWRILRLLTAIAGSRTPAASIDQTLARAWGVGPRGVDLLRQALILCADHELNVSSFTARCVASAGSHPYAVVLAGLAALEGSKHGGISARIESMLASLRRVRSLQTGVIDRLRRGERVDGFGHPLYRAGDPRATELLRQMRERYSRSAELAFVMEAAAAGTSATREHPNVDFALAALARVLRLPDGSALTIFALGRTIGWIGHAIEQYETAQLIRPRAKYVGPSPISVQ
jgi:citrate synthase